MSDAPSLGDLLRRIGGELAAQADAAEALADLVPLLPPLDAPMQARAQSIDALAQHLGELARLLDRLAPEAGGRPVPGETLAEIRLADLAARLAGRTAAEPPANSGALDLF